MLEVKDLCLEVGGFSLRNVSLQAASNEYFVLLGPTGAGKSLFLKCLCGILRARSGSIHIDGQEVTHLEPRGRRIGYVPQDAGLFPHMTVEENITFPLRVRRLPRREAVEKVRPVVRTLDLEPLIGRSPDGLSGGERQKVALARALATEPKLLLLDEPVSALDEPTRQQVCAVLRRVHSEQQVTTLHVSHNIEEALTVSDRAGILNAGELIQCGPMGELLRHPRNETVARFLRTENIFTAKAEPLADGGSELRFADRRIRIPQRRDGDVKFIVRPESLRVVGADSTAENTVPAVLVSVTDRGAYQRLELDAGVRVVVHAALGGNPMAAGERCAILIPPDAVHVLDAC